MAAIAMVAMGGRAQAAGIARSVSFSGHTWTVKATATEQMGPGPNWFSDSAENVWVDERGRLHLRVSKRANRWYSAEVVNQLSLGYGTYRFYLDSPVDTLDPNVVLGLFTYSHDADYAHREIDIEFSRWGQPNNLNAQYVVQPYVQPQNYSRWQMPAIVGGSTHSFLWQPGSVFFQSLSGLTATPTSSSVILRQTTMTEGIPAAGNENIRMNLWLLSGKAPMNRSAAEVIINRFEFTPAG